MQINDLPKDIAATMGFEILINKGEAIWSVLLLYM